MEGYPVPRAPPPPSSLLWSLTDWPKRPQSDGPILYWQWNSIPEFLEILKPGNEKGVPKKIQSLIYEAGVQNQNFKILKKTINPFHHHSVMRLMLPWYLLSDGLKWTMAWKLKRSKEKTHNLNFDILSKIVSENLQTKHCTLGKWAK